MENRIKIWLFGWIQVLAFANLAQGQAIKVTCETTLEVGFQLYRNGQPYDVKGVGGDAFMETAVEIGANSIRLWGAENAGTVLDKAHKLGLTVMLGLWMPPERHGFDYSDPMACKDQLEQFRAIVKKYKNHPALLLWGVGNEVDLEYTDFSVWYAVQGIAAMIHEEDGLHPTCVVTAGIDVAEVKLIEKHCPDIDILGVNTYGDLPALPQKIKEFGWKKPYMVTEWGPNGHWEVTKVSWGAPIEQTSEQKAITYKERYTKYIAGDAGKCIGSYAFLWGQKQETTPTWYGMFIHGKATPAVTVLHQLWNPAKETVDWIHIDSFMLDKQLPESSLIVRKNKKVAVNLVVKDGLNQSLDYRWEIMPESQFTKSGGDAEIMPEAIPIKVKTEEGAMFFNAPAASGAYRLFVYISDNNRRIATANFPFFVK